MARYYPILKSKEAEFRCLEEISKHTRRLMTPVFDISEPPENAARFRESTDVYKDHLLELAERIAVVSQDKLIYTDFPNWAPDASIGSGESVYSFLDGALSDLGVNNGLMVSYDRWEDPIYQNAMKTADQNGRTICIRLEADALDDINDLPHFKSVVSEIIDELEVTPENASLLIDPKDVYRTPIHELISLYSKATSIAQEFGFGEIIVSGNSMPTNIVEAVSQENSTSTLVRREFVAFKAICDQFPQRKISHSDYVVRSPLAGDNIIAPDANGKIRYTIQAGFFVVRGYSKRKGIKGKQMYGLSEKLIQSPHYMGPQFSWGDKKIAECTPDQWGPGNPTDWIAIDSSHHITYVAQEVSAVVAATHSAAVQDSM